MYVFSKKILGRDNTCFVWLQKKAGLTIFACKKRTEVAFKLGYLDSYEKLILYTSV